MEANRIWHEPEVIVYGNAITPGTRCSGEAYDIANRKWYQLNVNVELEDDEWTSQVLEKHISTYFHVHGENPPWNVINTKIDETVTSFELKSNDRVARLVRKKLLYDTSKPTPTISSDQITKKLFLGRAADRCLWEGKDCALKRMKFDCDVERVNREIQIRENLLVAMGNASTSMESLNNLMHSRFNVLPIVAVVLEPDIVNQVAGILMPYGGPSLESMFKTKPGDPAIQEKFSPDGITLKQLRDLTRALRELNLAGIQHGDINDRNTRLYPANQFSESLTPDKRLVLIDLGEVAPEYISDAVALGELFVLCKPFVSLRHQEVVDSATRMLQKNGDFDGAISILDEVLKS